MADIPESLRAIQDLTRRHCEIGSITFLHNQLCSFANRAEDQGFTLAVLGGFSRGKSTFINTLLRAEVVPTSVLPSTTAYTRIRYGPEPSAELWFDGRAPQTVSLDQAMQYVATAEQQVENLRAIHIFFPSPYLECGVNILDSPGFGSVYTDHREISLRCVAEADAAVFVMSTDPLLSAWECDFVRDAWPQVGLMIFVQTKIDKTPEWNRPLGLNSSVLETRSGIQAPQIFPISAHRMQAYQQNGFETDYESSRFQPLEDELADCLGRARTQIVAQKRQAMLHFATSNLQRQLNAGLGEKQASLAVLEQQLDSLRRELQGRKEGAQTLLAQIMAPLHRLRPAAREIIGSKYELVEARFESYVSEKTLEEMEDEAGARLLGLLQWAVQRVRLELDDILAQGVKEARRSLGSQLPVAFAAHREIVAPPLSLHQPTSLVFDIDRIAVSKRPGRGGWGVAVGGALGTLVAPGVGTAVGAGLGGMVGRAIKKGPKHDLTMTREAYVAQGTQIVTRQMDNLRRQADRQLASWQAETATKVWRSLDRVHSPERRRLERQIAELQGQVTQVSQQILTFEDSLRQLRLIQRA